MSFMEWDSIIIKMRENPIGINIWGPMIKENCNKYLRSHETHSDAIDNSIRKIYDALVFKADARLYLNSITELYNIIEVLSSLFQLNNDDAYSTLIALTAPDMIKVLEKCSPTKAFNIEFDITMSIFNFFIPTDYVEYTIYHVFFGLPFMIELLVRKYDPTYIGEKMSRYNGSLDNEPIVRSNLTKMVYYLWDTYSKREMREDCLKRFYIEFHESYYDKELTKIINQYTKRFGNRKDELKNAIKEINFIIYRYPEDCAIRIAQFLTFNCRYILGEGDEPKNSLINDAIMLLKTCGIVDPTLNADEIMKIVKNSTDSLYKEVLDNSINIAEESLISSLPELNIVLESSKDFRTKTANIYKKASTKISRGYDAFKRNEAAVDNQMSKIIGFVKRGFIGDTRTEIIEGKEFSLITLLKRVLRTAAVFHFSKIGALLYVITGKIMRGKARTAERQKLMMELDEEIDIISEKIDDAKADENKRAKYQLMRTKKELENARDRIRYNITADEKSDKTAGKILGVNTVTNRTR